jgi:glucose-1-phosphate thymidylyltransferase
LKAIVLAAGYATRMYPLTVKQPKSLLSIAGKPLIEHLLEHLIPVSGLEHIYIVVNEKFENKFQDWLGSYNVPRAGIGVSIVTNNSADPSTKAGAVGSLSHAITHEKVDDDIIVVAADNLFTASLEGFGAFASGKGAPVVAVYDVGEVGKSREYSFVEINEAGRVVFFEEKPEQPRTSTIGVALYYYPRSSLPLIRRYVREGNKLEHIGSLVQWMYCITEFFTWRVPCDWYDIGTIESLEAANRAMSNSG